MIVVGKDVRLGIIVLCFMMCSCEGWVLPPDPPNRADVIFDQLWNDFQQRYAFFGHKKIDWVSIKEKYHSKITSELDDKKLFEIMSDMLFELKDGHVSLESSFGRSKNWEWFINYPPDYNESNIFFSYLKKDFWVSGPLTHQVIDSVHYINYRSFVKDITEDNLEAILKRSVGLKGVIIDIRNNSGGNLRNAYKLASIFTGTEAIFAHQRMKNGPGVEDFSAWRPMVVRPGKRDFFDGNVVVLTNRRSYSASTFFAQMMRVLPHVVLMGDATGGGGGTPAYGELSNGWIYRFSSSQTIDLDGNQLEDGVPVTFRVRLRRSDEIAGKDSLIDEALRYLSGTSSFK
jgi:hypothetical protein